MAELVPVPLHVLLRRAHHEYRLRRAIFDLPERKFRRPANTAGPSLDLSVPYAGARAANPIGPAAGPHTQLAQNIALGWLAGARIFELKTIQINDRLTLVAPVHRHGHGRLQHRVVAGADARGVAARVREGVDAASRSWALGTGSLGRGLDGRGGTRDRSPDPFVFDISVGYDLEGIRSPAVVQWLDSMRDASAIVDELRREIPDEFAPVQGLPVPDVPGDRRHALDVSRHAGRGDRTDWRVPHR